MRTLNPAASLSRRRKGFSLLEIMMVVAAISTVAAIAVLGFSGTRAAATSSKLRSDVATLNAAIRSYALNGGSLAGAANADAVIAKLKTTADVDSAGKMASVRGAMIDPRLTGVPSTGNGPERAIWIPSRSRFIIADNGAGYVEFNLDGGAGPAAEEARRNALDLGIEDKWVWNFGDSTPVVAVASPPGVGGYTDSAPAADPTGLVRLLPPVFNTPGAVYDLSAYSPTLPVSLQDPNPSGDGQIYYSVNGGDWMAWNGVPLQLAPAYVTTIRAFVAPMDPDSYEQSDLRTSDYETVFFSGVVDGGFTKPKGPGGLVTNLTGSAVDPHFTFGSPAVSAGFTKPNSLDFTGSSFTNIAPDQEFALGTLSYYNGTTYTATNATAVTLKLAMDLTSPGATEDLSFDFTLNSTPNTGVSADADADYVYIPTVSSKFNTLIKGKKYYLVLSFGSHGAGGFTTIDTFHAHEDTTLTGTIYGRFTLTPP